MASESELLPGAVHQDPFNPETFVHYNGTWFPQNLQPSPELFKDIKELKLHKDDVFVTGFPKSGEQATILHALTVKTNMVFDHFATLTTRDGDLYLSLGKKIVLFTIVLRTLGRQMKLSSLLVNY